MKDSERATVAEEGGPAEQSKKLKETAEANDIPEDVLAVLQAEIELKTAELAEERNKLRQQLDEKDDEIHELSQRIRTIKEQVGYRLSLCPKEG